MSRGIRFAIALALVAAIPIRANSGAAITTSHPLSFSLKLVSQTQASNGDDRADKETIDWKEVFEECVGDPPTSKQAIYLFMSCSDLNDNTIMAINTDPVSGIDELGEIDFDLVHQIVIEKNDELKQVLMPAVVELQCNMGATDITLQGVMDLKFAGNAPQECPESGKLTLSGSGNTPSVFCNLLMNAGSTITVKKRNSAISGAPPL
jgi:hypothetical protein